MAGEPSSKDTLRLLIVFFMFLSALMAVIFYAVDRIAYVGQAISTKNTASIEKSENVFGKNILFIILSLVIVAFISLFAISMTERKTEEHRLSNRLADYISFAEAHGMEPKKVQASLISLGWKEADVETAYHDALNKKVFK